MKISVNWLKEFTNVKLSVDELVTKIGAQLGEVEEVIDYGKQYEGVIVAKIVQCDPHPNADKLHVCKIDDGGMVKKVKRDEKGLVQVVCGAPNVRKGLTVAWLPPGTIVPSTYDNEQFTLEVRPLRGVDSNGMLASSKELNIGDDHDGILVVDKKAKPGTSFAELYELNDYIIDIENKMFTHRPDCFGLLGVAREIAGIQGIEFKSPPWYLDSLPLKASKDQKMLPLTVKNNLEELVPRFTAVALSDIKVKKSPIIMQSCLSRLGVKPINNIVDITNFVMLLTGQPLHAYDYDKVAAQDNADQATFVVRHPNKAEKVALLNGKTIEPHPKAIMIATNKRLLGVGGIMGGTDTEVDFSTTNVIVECATFDMYSIRKTSMAHGLFTDAVTRFNKGQSPLQNDVVLTYAVGMMQKIAGAELASKVIDTAPEKSVGFWKGIHITRDFINERLGLDLSTKQITTLLSNVEMGVTSNGQALIVSPPFWRTDLEIPEDIVEEVGRLYGYDQLPLVLPKRDLTPAHDDQLLTTKSQLRRMLARAGANEVLTYSFVHSDLLKKVGQDETMAFKLANALSPDLQYYRLSLSPSLLDKVHANIKAGFETFALFEINKVHNKTDLDSEKLPKEHEVLALVFAAKKAGKGAPYFQAKALLDYVCDTANVALSFVPLGSLKPGKDACLQQMLQPFEPKRSAALVDSNKKVWGVVGEYRASVRKQLKLPACVAGFELNLAVFSAGNSSEPRYQPLSKFPKTHQDISFKIAAKTNYTELENTVQQALITNATQKGYIADLSPVDIYQDTEATKHITFRITLSHPDRTLVTNEVNTLLEAVAKQAYEKTGAVRL